MPIIEVRMPEENEGTEASLGRWIKQPGDHVSEHEPLIEINTDKVTIEVPSPASGVLVRHAINAGDPVQPGDLLGAIDTQVSATDATQTATNLKAVTANDRVSTIPEPEEQEGYSPAVRRLLKQHSLDPAAIPRSGRGARLSSADIEAYLARRATKSPAGVPQEASGLRGRLIPHTPMRKSIATHMARSVQTAPHVTSVFEADLSAVLADRNARKQAGEGDVPSVTAYLLHAAVQAIRKVPEVNSRWRDAHLEVFDEINFGVGTALESGGLVVPIIRNAQTLGLAQLSDALRAMTLKARAGRLTQADMADGTFTLSNHGVSGSLLAAPIILPHGQAAILGAGKMQKRVIVCETGGRELFRVRPMMYVTLTVDHRVLDGQQTNGFLTEFVAALEGVAAAGSED